MVVSTWTERHHSRLRWIAIRGSRLDRLGIAPDSRIKGVTLRSNQSGAASELFRPPMPVGVAK